MDVSLADAVREFPALYDKSKKEHHDKFIVNNCWVKVGGEGVWVGNRVRVGNKGVGRGGGGGGGGGCVGGEQGECGEQGEGGEQG